MLPTTHLLHFNLQCLVYAFIFEWKNLKINFRGEYIFLCNEVMLMLLYLKIDVSIYKTCIIKGLFFGGVGSHIWQCSGVISDCVQGTIWDALD